MKRKAHQTVGAARAARGHVGHEDEAVRVFFQRKLGEDASGERSIAGVIFGELVVQQQVLDEGQGAVGDVLVNRHSPLERPHPQNPRTKNAIK